MEQIASWTQPSSENESLSIIKDLALSHAREGGKQGEYLANCIVSGDFSSLCDFNIDYLATSAYEAYNCRQAIAFFSKYRGLDLGRDRRAKAVATFKADELKNRSTNELFEAVNSGKASFRSPLTESIIFRSQRKISRVLGLVPRLDELKFRFGPGATALTKKRHASAVEKLTAGFSCSEDLLPYAKHILEEMPAFCDLHATSSHSRLCDKEECWTIPVKLVDGVMDFVVKNWETDRTILKEGSLNTMVQLSIGDHMSRRMRRFGIDLSNQSINQKLALEGSLSGNLATLDLKSASNTISRELVATLLPVDWYLFLDSCRSSVVRLDGERIKLEMFSSMGNGFTFPLESLIFWALCSSINEDHEFTSVYGDDIVVRTHSVPAVKQILEDCGFTLNLKKSYWTGPFRESCGADYIRGINIRPFYQKEILTPAGLFLLHNYYWRNRDIERAELILKKINPSLRIFGPDGFGDGHLVRDDWVPRRHKKATSHGYGGVLFDTFKLIGVRDKRALRPGDRVLPLYSIYIRENAEEFLPELDNFDTAPKERILSQLSLQGRVASEPIPERVSPVDGSHIKCVSLPGTSGYRRVTIYTFETSR